MTTGEDNGKQPEESEWVHKAPEEKVGFDLECVKETFMEVKKISLRLLPQEIRIRSLKKWTHPSLILFGDLYEATTR